MKRQRINLIPIELRPKIEVPPSAFSLGMSAFLLAAMATSSTTNYLTLESRRKELARVAAQKAEITQQINALTTQSQMLAQDQARYASVQEVLSKKTYWVEIFKELTALMPKGVWLTNLTSALSDHERSLNLKGETDSQEKVAEFYRVLEKSFYFGAISMKSSEKQADFKPTLFRFEFNIPISDEKYGKI